MVFGSTIVEIRNLTEEELNREGWNPDEIVPAIIFEGGFMIYPSGDEEGNYPGCYTDRGIYDSPEKYIGLSLLKECQLSKKDRELRNWGESYTISKFIFEEGVELIASSDEEENNYGIFFGYDPKDQKECYMLTNIEETDILISDIRNMTKSELKKLHWDENLQIPVISLNNVHFIPTKDLKLSDAGHYLNSEIYTNPEKYIGQYFKMGIQITKKDAEKLKWNIIPKKTPKKIRILNNDDEIEEIIAGSNEKGSSPGYFIWWADGEKKFHTL